MKCIEKICGGYVLRTLAWVDDKISNEEDYHRTTIQHNFDKIYCYSLKKHATFLFFMQMFHIAPHLHELVDSALVKYMYIHIYIYINYCKFWTLLTTNALYLNFLFLN